jgi:hypothetical protein
VLITVCTKKNCSYVYPHDFNLPIRCLVVNSVDMLGKNALHYAIESKNDVFVNILVTVPYCDPNFPDRNRMSPLHLAVKQASPTIVAALVASQNEIQIDPNAINEQGQTALHIAAGSGYQEIVQILLQPNSNQACDPSIIDKFQVTAYQLAEANHHDACAKLINDYTVDWRGLSMERDDSTTDKKTTRGMPMNPMNESDDDSSSETRSEADESSKASPVPVRPTIHQWSDKSAVTTGPKQGVTDLADLVRNRSTQQGLDTAPEYHSTNPTLPILFANVPLQPPVGPLSINKSAKRMFDCY